MTPATAHPEPRTPDDDEQLRLNEQWQAQQREQARLENYGVYAVARLPGEVGLLELRYLHRPEWGGETLGKAMDFLAEQRALIIDLRGCTGGYPGMVALLCSYLFGETPIHLSSIYWQDDHTTQEFWTQAELPYRRFTGRAVFLLTSRETFSAGEMLAQLLQSFGRARLLGEKTDGGAHPGVSYRLAPHFEAFIPVGRAFDPRSGQDWEGKGVTPEIRLPAEEALGEAYRMAVEGVSAG